MEYILAIFRRTAVRWWRSQRAPLSALSRSRLRQTRSSSPICCCCMRLIPGARAGNRNVVFIVCYGSTVMRLFIFSGFSGSDTWIKGEVCIDGVVQLEAVGSLPSCGCRLHGVIIQLSCVFVCFLCKALFILFIYYNVCCVCGGASLSYAGCCLFSLASRLHGGSNIRYHGVPL